MYLSVTKFIFLFSLVLMLHACNKNLSEEEKKELWSKAQTSGEIIKRSGTKFSSGKNKELALSDAQNRLQSGGGLFGNKGINFSNLGGLGGNDKSNNVSLGMPINPFFWRASIDTISFMPLVSADPFGGIIITDWHSTTNNNERCKLNIFIKGKEMKTENLKVNSFCQKLINNNWIDQQINEENNIKIENAILNKAKKLRLSQG